ncbi:MAG: cyclic nucleotide-binding domain-containing protein [Candidatus Cloacimonetes bacterium]|nr:cyclic nucleotide-binding domain-containing protein [Candidatus Cloacimonadota bacterium]
MAYKDYRKMNYSQGDIVIKQGEQSEEIYIILSGSVECKKKNSSGKEYITEILKKGDVFGELNLVFGGIKQHTVVAKTDLEVEIIDPRLFSKLFDSELNPYIAPIIQAFSKRIREYEIKFSELHDGIPEERIQEEEEFIQDDHSPNAKKVYLKAETNRALIALHGEKSIEIKSFPFRVGRYSRRRSDMLFHRNELYLHDRHPFNISRSHFAILHKRDGFYFQDYGSWHGSELNGVMMVNPGKKELLMLKTGENPLKIGNLEADLIFTLIIK